MGVFGDRLNRAPGHDAEVAEVQKVSFSDYLLASVNPFDCFEHTRLLFDCLKPQRIFSVTTFTRIIWTRIFWLLYERLT